MSTLKAFERVYLTENLLGTRYVKGDVGVIAHVYDNGVGFEVEFFAADGSTLSVETVLAHQLRSCAGIKAVLHIHNEAA